MALFCLARSSSTAAARAQERRRRSSCASASTRTSSSAGSDNDLWRRRRAEAMEAGSRRVRRAANPTRVQPRGGALGTWLGVVCPIDPTLMDESDKERNLDPKLKDESDKGAGGGPRLGEITRRTQTPSCPSGRGPMQRERIDSCNGWFGGAGSGRLGRRVRCCGSFVHLGGRMREAHRSNMWPGPGSHRLCWGSHESEKGRGAARSTRPDERAPARRICPAAT